MLWPNKANQTLRSSCSTTTATTQTSIASTSRSRSLVALVRLHFLIPHSGPDNLRSSNRPVINRSSDPLVTAHPPPVVDLLEALRDRILSGPHTPHPTEPLTALRPKTPRILCSTTQSTTSSLWPISPVDRDLKGWFKGYDCHSPQATAPTRRNSE